MSLLTQFRSLFTKPNPLPEPSAATLMLPLPDSQPAVSEPVTLPAIPMDTERSLPAWLDDEDWLRDEGVIFGLSDTKPDERISIIRHEFAHQTAGLTQTAEEYNEKIGELNLFIDQHENQIGELQHKTDELTRQPPADHQLPRTLAGLSLSIMMCVGTFFLIDETLRPAFAESRWIAVGVFLAGMFSLFSRTSLFHETGSPTTARRLLEEIGLPLAASVFVFVQALQTQSAGKAIALLVFVFFLFLLAGKLLLGNLTVFWSDLHAVNRNRRLSRDIQTKTVAWSVEIAERRADIDRLRVQKWQIIPQLNRVQAELTRLNARRDGLITLFLSEFSLARSLRDRLTNEQREDILNQR